VTPTSSELENIYRRVAVSVCRADNDPPLVSAGPDKTTNIGISVSLDGSVSDDGRPVGSVLVVNWSKLSGPGEVTFSNQSAATTTATFSLAGSYILRLTVTDSKYTVSSGTRIYRCTSSELDT
jgi:hypothetical protein